MGGSRHYVRTGGRPYLHESNFGMQSLEVEGQSGANGTRGLHEIKRAAILSDKGNISLREQVAQVDQGFHVAGEEAGGKRLAHKDVQVWIGTSGRGVEHIHHAEHAWAAGPF